jgi:hypothetical protein
MAENPADRLVEVDTTIISDPKDVKANELNLALYESLRTYPAVVTKLPEASSEQYEVSIKNNTFKNVFAYPKNGEGFLLNEPVRAILLPNHIAIIEPYLEVLRGQVTEIKISGHKQLVKAKVYNPGLMTLTEAEVVIQRSINHTVGDSLLFCRVAGGIPGYTSVPLVYYQEIFRVTGAEPLYGCLMIKDEEKNIGWEYPKFPPGT